MKKRVYTLNDQKSGLWTPPFTALNDEVAKATIGSAVLDSNSQTPLAKYPSDFRLFCVAEWDESSGKIIPITPEFINDAFSLAQIEMRAMETRRKLFQKEGSNNEQSSLSD